MPIRFVTFVVVCAGASAACPEPPHGEPEVDTREREGPAEVSTDPDLEVARPETVVVDPDTSVGPPDTEATLPDTEVAVPACPVGTSGRACDDGQPCTDDACLEGRCTHPPRSGPCDDGDLCTEGDHCEMGRCVGAAMACPAPGACRTVRCEPSTGCVVADAPAKSGCDDGNACTTGTACALGTCRGTLIRCDDGDPCSDDYCDSTTGCSHRNNRAPCDDGDRCTLEDRCEDGRCRGVAALTCCTDDLACDDGDGCTTDRCEGASCAHRPLACDDGDRCTRDECDAGTCTHVAWSLPAGGLAVADFEGDLGAWRFASSNPLVGWRADRAWAASGATSLYCGDTPGLSYDHGPTRASASTRFLVPPGTPTIDMMVKAELDEAGSCVYDVLELAIDGVVIGLICGSGEGLQSFSLAAFEGREVELSLVFDTVDGLDNAGRGVWVDDIRVTTAACR